MTGESTKLGQPSSADLALRAQLHDRHGVETVRFIWQADSSGRLIKLSPELEKITERPAASFLGQPISQFIQTQGCPLDLALRSQVSLTGIPAVWPLASAEAWVPASLGLVRNIDSKGVPLGVNGFGLLHLNQAFIQQDLKLTRRETSHEITPAPAQASLANVIPLRRLSKLQHHNPVQESVLSETELSAFNEIARALTDDEFLEEKKTLFSPPPSLDKSAVSDRGSIELASLLDRLPLGVIVSRRKELLFANNFLLKEFGYKDISALIKDGGLTRVFGAYDPDNLINTPKFIKGDLEASGLIADWGGAAATIIFILKTFPEIDHNMHHRDAVMKEAHAAPICVEHYSANSQNNFSNEIAAVISADGRIEHVTTRFSELFVGKKVSDLEGYYSPFFKSETQEAISRAIDRIRGGAKETLELICSDDAEKFEALLSCTPQALGKINISLRHNIQQLPPVRSDNKGLDNHASGDLLSLLQSILAQKEELFMERFGSLDCESNNQKIRNIRGSILQTLSSIDDYLQSSQSQARIDDFVLSNVEINELIAECVALTQSLARQKKVVMRLALVSESFFIRLHVPSLRRALLKILTNAVQFNLPGGQVIVSTAISNHQTISIKIKDTGVGMSEDEVTTALDSLNRSNETRQPSGRNIYLTDAEKLIAQTFASFSITSEKKQGTLITIDFPLSNLSAAE